MRCSGVGIAGVGSPGSENRRDRLRPNGPLLPIEFCRISADGRLTLVIDEIFGDVCKTYSAPSAFDNLDAAIENFSARRNVNARQDIGFVEFGSGKQSAVALSAIRSCRNDRRLG